MGLKEFLEECSVIRDSEGYTVHLRAKRGDLPSYALTCGSPERVKKIIPFLTDVEVVNDHRGLYAIRGMYEDLEIFAVASGMGSPSMAIVYDEWLFNTDMEKYTSPTIVRVGSAGSWNKEVGMNDLIISNGVVRDDGASQSVAPLEFPGIVDMITTLCLIHAANELGHVEPYKVHVGPTICKDNLYADEDPNGHSAMPEMIMEKQLAYERLGVLATSMESGSPSVLAQLYNQKARDHDVELDPAYACILTSVSPYYGETEDIVIEYNDDTEVQALRIALEALKLKSLVDKGQNVVDITSIKSDSIKK